MTRRTPGERWYRRILRLYPRDFRDEFGEEMTRLYRDRGRTETSWSLWRSLVLDAVHTAPSEHLSILRQDLRHARRSLSRTPVITATAILTLALGVGASTAIFSVLHAILLRPLPYPEANRLVEMFEANLKTGTTMRASALNYLSWAQRSERLETIAAFRSTALTLTGDGDPELLGGSLVTASLFRVLGLRPMVGRPLQPDDEQPGSPRVVVLSESLWRSRFAGDRQIVGRSMMLDGQRHQVIGVMPRAFREVGRAQVGATAAAQIFVPMVIDPAQENRANHTLRVVGRLRAGATIDEAREEMRMLASAMEREFPTTNASWSVGIGRLSETMIDPYVRRSLLLVFGAVAMVFLIACANVANLLLAQAMRRQVELAVRSALGARRSRLVRQFITESSCLAVISGAIGAAAAVVVHPLLRGLLPATLPRLDDMRVDVNVLAFGLLISIVSGLVFGAVPALRASRLDPARSLTAVGRGTPDVSRVRLRQMLIVGQVALATMLLVVAALLLQGFVRLQHVPLGFDPDRVLTTRISLPPNAYSDAGRISAFYDRLLTMLEGSGQLEAAGVATSAPFAPGVRASYGPPQRDRMSPEPGRGLFAAEHIVSGGYFRVLSVPLLAGRFFNERDVAEATPVAVVSQRFARIVWPEKSPLGQTLERAGRQYEVVGIAGDVRGSDTEGPRGGGADREPRAAVYFAAAQSPQRTMTLLVRSKGEPISVIASLRDAVRQLDPNLPLPQTRPLRDWFSDSVSATRLTTTLAIVFAIFALLLTSVGIYGVLAQTVATRTREIGVRMAIGATGRRVLALVLRDGMTWAVSGIILGLLGAFGAARLIAALLFDVPAHDPVTFVTAACAVALVAMMACAIPAARAVRIDPTIAMRAE